MARTAQAAPVLRIVGVEAGGDEGTPVLGVVVGMPGWLSARGAVSVTLLLAHARRVALKDGATEAALVHGVVATLSCAASCLLRCAPVFVALPVLRVLGAAGL
ncbi:hypothetical protein ACUXZZ_20550 [Streptomyces graminifolii]|uniref:hypothetical protein n=1 Tax=Streptomyces graminifolii TaxID=1266771 RepID=UPI004059670E